MKNTMILWRLELKKTINIMPAMLFEAALLLAVLSAVAFGVGKLIYRDSPAIQINVAIVEEEENPLTDVAVNYIQGMENISEFCRFTFVAKEEGLAMLKDGRAAALLYVPGGMIEGIMNGNNVPAQIFFPENAGIESAMLKELTDAGVQMLKVAQAEIYGIYDTARTYGALDGILGLEAGIDMYNLEFALDRLALFQEQRLSATGSLTLFQYETASGMIAFLMLIGMSCYPVMQPYPDALRRQLKRCGTGIGRQCFGKWLCGLCSIIINALFFGILVRMILTALGHSDWLPAAGLRQAGTAFIIILCIATFIFMIFQLAGNGSSAILILFFLSVLMMYFSGGILPSVFLPQAARSIGKILPASYLIEAAGSMYAGAVRGKTIGILLLYTAAFGAVSYAVRRIRRV